METFSNLRTEVRDAVGLITIDRPQARNALNTATFRELESALTRLEADPAVAVVIVTGSGDRAFIAGADIEEMRHIDGVGFYRDFGALAHRVMRRFEECPKPTVAAVNGWALGGGAELMLALDVRFVAENARIGFPEVTLGIFPGAGGTQRLIRQIPLCRAKDLLFTGDPIDARQALELGLVNRVTTASALMDEAWTYASRLAQRPRTAMRLMKAAIVSGLDSPLSVGLAHERALAGLSFATADAGEGLSAFAEKRKPRFAPG